MAEAVEPEIDLLELMVDACFERVEVGLEQEVGLGGDVCPSNGWEVFHECGCLLCVEDCFRPYTTVPMRV